MMGHQSRQMAMIFVDMESLIPENHLLRKIDRMVSFDFIYDLLAPYYPATGRPSIDPASMFKMLLMPPCLRNIFRISSKFILKSFSGSKNICQIVATEGLNPSKTQLYQAFPGLWNYSHSLLGIIFNGFCFINLIPHFFDYLMCPYYPALYDGLLSNCYRWW